MEFDLEYKLQQFREVEKDYFDENNERYSTKIGKESSEMMLQLINELECALAKAETELGQLTIPVVTHRTCYNCKFCMYESNKPKHAQFTCLGTIDLNNITDPHHHICKLWDE